MDISTRQSGAATIVDVVGDITLYNSPQVRKVLLELLKDKNADKLGMALVRVLSGKRQNDVCTMEQFRLKAAKVGAHKGE